MKTHYKILIFSILITSILKAQTHEVYNKSFDATKINTLVLNLEDTYVTFETSKDNKVHFNYQVEFTNYSKKEIENYLEHLKLISHINNQNLEFQSYRTDNLSNNVYTFETLYGITFEGNDITFKSENTREFRKSKQFFLNINNASRIESIKNYLKNIREVNNKGEKKKISPKSVKMSKTKFTIKVPEHLNYQIKARQSNLNFNNNISTLVVLNAKDTNLTFKNLDYPLNSFDVVNGTFKAEIINGGTFMFNHVNNITLAELNYCILQSEFSNFNLGEIGEHVEINDFNSKFWIHNFAHNFGTFIMTTEYSEINLFYPENTEYLLTTFGHDTKFYTTDLVTIIQPSKKGISSKMMIIGDETKNHTNKIEINTIHGIIKFGQDFIDVVH